MEEVGREPAPDPAAPRSAPAEMPSLTNIREELLDLAATMALVTSEGVKDVSSAVSAIAGATRLSISAEGNVERARLAGQIAYLSEELRRRKEMKTQLDGDLVTRAELRRSLGAVDGELNRVELQIRFERQRAQEARLDDLMSGLAAEERAAMHGARASAEEDLERRTEAWKATEADRERRINDIEEVVLPELRKREAAAADREECLRGRLINRTVAGYLRWLGYASVFATGTVLAGIMSPTTMRFDVVVMSWRAIVRGIAPSWPLLPRLLGSVGLLTFFLGLVTGAVAFCDRFIQKRGGWRGRRGEDDTQQEVRLTPAPVRRRSYVQLVAMFPFILAAGIVMTILAAAPAAPGEGDLLAAVLPTVGYTFVGSTIAFLATAVFMMYLVRIIDARDDARPRDWRRSWEFVVPPLVLIGALIALAFMPTLSGRPWLPWAAFMLLSSIALACGIVYHGVFHDVTKVREAIAEAQRVAATLASPPLLQQTPAQRRRVNAVEQRYADIRKKLEDERATVRAAFNEPARGSNPVTTRWFGRVVQRFRSYWQHTSVTMQTTTTEWTYTPIDYSAGSELIREREQLAAIRAAIAQEVAQVEQAIEVAQRLLQWESVSALIEKRERLHGERVASQHEDEHRQHLLTASEQQVLIAIKVTGASAAATKPFFEEAKDDYPLIARPVQPIALPRPTPEGAKS